MRYLLDDMSSSCYMYHEKGRHIILLLEKMMLSTVINVTYLKKSTVARSFHSFFLFSHQKRRSDSIKSTVALTAIIIVYIENFFWIVEGIGRLKRLVGTKRVVVT